MDEASVSLSLEQLRQAWDAVTQVLGRAWRGSSLVECVNSLLRPRLNSRKQTDQGCLELFRFLHKSLDCNRVLTIIIIAQVISDRQPRIRVSRSWRTRRGILQRRCAAPVQPNVESLTLT